MDGANRHPGVMCGSNEPKHRSSVDIDDYLMNLIANIARVRYKVRLIFESTETE
jgi:hypothetical protein